MKMATKFEELRGSLFELILGSRLVQTGELIFFEGSLQSLKQEIKIKRIA